MKRKMIYLLPLLLLVSTYGCDDSTANQKKYEIKLDKNPSGKMVTFMDSKDSISIDEFLRESFPFPDSIPTLMQSDLSTDSDNVGLKGIEVKKYYPNTDTLPMPEESNPKNLK